LACATQPNKSNQRCSRAPCLSTPVPFSCATARVARHRCCPLSGAVLCEAGAQIRLVVRSLFCVVSLCRNEKEGGPPLRTAMGRRKMGGTVAMCKRILPALRRESKGIVVEYPWQEPGTATAVMQDRREELLRMNLVINPALRKVIAQNPLFVRAPIARASPAHLRGHAGQDHVSAAWKPRVYIFVAIARGWKLGPAHSRDVRAVNRPTPLSPSISDCVMKCQRGHEVILALAAPSTCTEQRHCSSFRTKSPSSPS
jgi:hypothetical protein